MKNILLIFCTLCVVFASCNRFQNKAKEKTGERIVCVSKELNEIIFAVGGDTALVGIDLSSTYPPETKKLTTVGYHRALSAEGIISLSPTVVWHDGNMGPDAVTQQLVKVGIPMRKFEPSKDIPSAKALIMEIAGIFHNETKGAELCRKLDADMAKVDSMGKIYKDKPRVMIIHFGRAANQYFVLNRKGTPNQMIEWSIAENAADTAQKWKNLSPEVVAAAQPDVVLVTDFGYDLQGGVDKIKQLPGVGLSPAAKNNRIYRIEEHDLVYFGPRTGENVLNMMQLIHQKK